MGIISKLRSVLDSAGGGSGGSDDGAHIAVAREPEAAGERAVKGGHASQPPSSDSGTTAAAASDAGGEPVDSIKGIGAAYAERLEAAGVHKVADLAEADPDDLAAATDIGAGRLGNWIERARAQAK